ncbi:MAG: hypothetical protein DRN88_03810 [Candidatus Hydrothermarchaeota archaeon]|nr:MAG: hypothetical protein DRN88_03810 [Candidatus Hydrothermarchaeota archaeon]
MAKFFGLEDLAIAKTLLQQETTELNSSESKRSFFLDKGSRLSFRDLTTALSTLSTRSRIIAEDKDINSFRQFLPELKFWASLAVGV